MQMQMRLGEGRGGRTSYVKIEISRVQVKVKYNADADYHLINDLVDDVLEDESLDKVSKERLESIDEKTAKETAKYMYL